MLFTNYEYYTTRFFGERIPEARFNRYASEASALADAETLGRIRKIVENTPQMLGTENVLSIPSEIQDCICAIAEILFGEGSLKIQSRSAGDESISYRFDETVPQETKINKALQIYLPSELLYRGFP